MDFDEMWDKMLEYNIVSEETLRVVTTINGNTVGALEDVLYVTTGCRNMEQYEEENLPWWDR